MCRSPALFELSYVALFVRILVVLIRSVNVPSDPGAQREHEDLPPIPRSPPTSSRRRIMAIATWGVPDMIVLHYTGMPDVEGAIAKLCTAARCIGALYRAGRRPPSFNSVRNPNALACRRGVLGRRRGINSCSIGIEIVNRGHDWGYPEFPLRQIAAVIRAVPRHHLRRSPPCARALGRSLRRARKIPARNFHGIRWPIQASAIGCSRRRSCARALKLGTISDDVRHLQTALAKYGYAVPTSGKYDNATAAVVNPPSSAISARRASTASPIIRR